MAKSIDALLFDLGGVVVKFDFNHAFNHWADRAGCTPASLRSRFSFDAAYERYERGEITDGDYFSSLRDTLGISLSLEDMIEGWNAIFVGEVPGISSLLAKASELFPLYIFSNSNPVHEQFWKRRYAPLLREFSGIFVSSSIGARKPEPESFCRVVRLIGKPPNRIMFFDDLIQNAEGARMTGMQSVHVKSGVEIAQTLERLIAEG